MARERRAKPVALRGREGGAKRDSARGGSGQLESLTARDHANARSTRILQTSSHLARGSLPASLPGRAFASSAGK